MFENSLLNYDDSISHYYYIVMYIILCQLKHVDDVLQISWTRGLEDTQEDNVIREPVAVNTVGYI